MAPSETSGLITQAYHARGTLGVVRVECEKACLLKLAIECAVAMEAVSLLIDDLNLHFKDSLSTLKGTPPDEP